MILTVTPNPAYDLTYRLDRFQYGAVQRIPEVRQRVGGKGLNVSRVLKLLGTDSIATGFADPAFSHAAEQDLTVDFVHALPWIRRTLVISESDGTTTGLWEPGAELTDSNAAAARLCRRIGELLPQLRGVVVSGSLPRGADPSLPADLARLAAHAGLPVICDVDGDALRHAARVPGVVLMPNTDELTTLTGHDPAGPESIVAVAQELLRAGAAAIIATRGPAGLIAITRAGSWSAALPTPITGNPTGAGDATAASVIAALASLPLETPVLPPDRPASQQGESGMRPDQPVLRLEQPASESPSWLASPHLDWPALLADAVATSAAAVARPTAGEIDQHLRTRLRPTVEVQRIAGPLSP